VIDIGSHPGHKVGILLVLTTLAIGNAAAVSWDAPESDAIVSSNVEGSIYLNVSGIDSSNAENLTLEYRDQGSSDSYESIKTVTADSSEYSYDSWNLAEPGSGEYELRARTQATDGSQVDTATRSITVDNSVSDPDSTSPTGFISNDDPEVSMDVSDDLSGINYSYLNVTDSDGNDVDSTKGTDPSIELSNIDDEQYTVDYTIVDNAGNSGSGSWIFTVDTSYDGDSNPSFSVQDEESGVVYFNEDKDLTVNFGDADSASDTTVTCYVGGENVDDFTVSAGDDDPDPSDTTCGIDHRNSEDYYDTSAEIYLEMEDEAGNTAESDSDTISFDVNPPSVTGLSIPTNAKLYNSNFDVEFTAFDSASEVEEVEYYFDSSTSLGEGNSLDYSSDVDSYEIDTSGLSAGDHTLHVRAKDEAARWSDPDTVDFSFDPDAVPEISLDVTENISVTAGEQESFDVTIENTGRIHVSSINVSGSAEGVFSGSQSISDLEPGESATVTLDIDTGANNLGEHTIEVSTDNPSRTKQIDLLVEANEEQQDQIDSDLSKYQGMLQEMEANVTELKQKVSEDKKQRIDSNFSTFKQKVEDAQSAVERGDYYEAEALLQNIDQDYSAAESSYKTVKDEYENNRFWMFVFLGLGGSIVAVVGLVGGLSYTDEVDFDIREYLEELQELEFDFDTSSLEKYTEKVKKMMEGKDTSDAEEFKWDGFDDN